MNENVSSDTTLWKGAILPSSVVALFLIITMSVVNGRAGLLGALLASVTVIIFFSIHLLVARISRDLSFLKIHGSDLRMPLAKKIHNKLYELRTPGKQRIRLIYTIVGLQIYLIHWFIKKTQKIPIKELKTALKRLTTI